MIIYHGSTDAIETPVIHNPSSGRDFGIGFYCTDIRDHAEKWALRQGRIRKQLEKKPMMMWAKQCRRLLTDLCQLK